MDRETAMRQAPRTAGIALSVLLCLMVAGTIAQVVMGGGPYVLMYLLHLQEDWQIAGAVAVTWLVALVPIVAVVCAIARAVAQRGGSVRGIMLGVAAYPAACVACVALTPESWEELRWIGFGHGFVAVPVALGVAIAWALVMSGGSRVLSAARSAATTATTASRWRPVA